MVGRQPEGVGGKAVWVRFCLSLCVLTTWSVAAAAQSGQAQEVDLDAFARKVAQETVRSLKAAGALKEPTQAKTAGPSEGQPPGKWQTSTSMEPTSARSPALGSNDAYNNINDSHDPLAAPINNPRNQSGWGAGIEMVIAKPLFGQEHGAGCCPDPQTRTPNHDAAAAPRLWLSWMSDAGYGLRARYFHLSSTSQTFGNSDRWIKERFKYNTVDFELAYRDAWTNWDVNWSMGARYLEMTSRVESPPFFKLSTFKGVGPAASIELRRRTDEGLAPFALFRGGFVAGEVRADGDINNDFLYVVDDMFAFYEASTGFEYQRAWGATTLFFKGALEATFMPRGGGILEGTGDQQEDHEHFAILGGAVSFGARF